MTTIVRWQERERDRADRIIRDGREELMEAKAQRASKKDRDSEGQA